LIESTARDKATIQTPYVSVDRLLTDPSIYIGAVQTEG
jgi:hypothetical protein